MEDMLTNINKEDLDALLLRIQDGKCIFTFEGLCNQIAEEVEIKVYHSVKGYDMVLIYFRLPSDGFYFITSTNEEGFKKSIEDKTFIDNLLSVYNALMHSDKQDDYLH